MRVHFNQMYKGETFYIKKFWVLLLIYVFILLFSYIWVGPSTDVSYEQGRKRPLDSPKRMIERREREGE